MAEVLVLVDHLGGQVKEITYELLTAARPLGEPSAVVVAAPGTAAQLTDALKQHCAEKIYLADTAHPVITVRQGAAEMESSPGAGAEQIADVPAPVRQAQRGRLRPGA